MGEDELLIQLGQVEIPGELHAALYGPYVEVSRLS